MTIMPVGVDLAKQVFQVHYVDDRTGEIVNKRISRAKFSEYGEVLNKGRAALRSGVPDVLGRFAERLPAASIETLREQWNGIARLDAQVSAIE